MITISLCMIVRNEEAVLERCLKSAGELPDEIVIVDTGSTDRTKEIAGKFTDKVFDFKWVDDFSKARNFSFSKGTMDYLMWLDADDVILPEDLHKLLALKKQLDKNYDIIAMKYNVGFDEHGNPTFHSTRGRLFKRENKPEWHDEIHEYVALDGNILWTEGVAITHRPGIKTQSGRNLRIYENALKKKGELSPRGKYYYARELKDHARFADAAIQFSAFLDEGKGWVEDNIAACFNQALCYKALGKTGEALDAMLRSFRFDAPRPEVCCLIGYHYKDAGDTPRAAAWFETALTLPERHSAGFVLTDYHRYIPAMELAVCYDNMGQSEKAAAFNELAGEAKPNSPQYLYNKTYFAGKGK